MPNYTEDNMHCPNCNHVLIKVQLNKTEVDHCNNCGSTLFDENEINRITLEDAQKLSEMKQSDSISGGEKISPKDGSVFTRLISEAIPQDVTILHSQSTGEIFAFPDDLVNFKKAQAAKINYFKIWNMPLPQLQNVLVYSFVLTLSLSAFYIASKVTQPTNQTIQANTICENNLEVIPPDSNNAEYTILCTTDETFTSSYVALCDNGELKKEVSLSPSSTHLASVPTGCTFVKLLLKDRNTIIETNFIPLN